MPRLLTFNMQGGGPAKWGQVAGNNASDVLCLQEVGNLEGNTNFEFVARSEPITYDRNVHAGTNADGSDNYDLITVERFVQLGFRQFGTETSGAPYYVVYLKWGQTNPRCSLAICSRHLVTEYSVINFLDEERDADDPDGSSKGGKGKKGASILRPLLGARINGVWFWSFHAPSNNGAAGAAREFLRLLDLPGARPWYCAGDYNCLPHTDYPRASADKKTLIQKFVDEGGGTSAIAATNHGDGSLKWREYRFTVAGEPLLVTANRAATQISGNTLDYVVTSENSLRLRAPRSEGGGGGGADHIPQEFEFEWPAMAGSSSGAPAIPAAPKPTGMDWASTHADAPALKTPDPPMAGPSKAKKRTSRFLKLEPAIRKARYHPYQRQAKGKGPAGGDRKQKGKK